MTSIARLTGIPVTAASSQQRLTGRRDFRGSTAPAFRQARGRSGDPSSVLAGWAFPPQSSPWAGAFAADTVTTPDAAPAALRRSQALASHTLPHTAASCNAHRRVRSVSSRQPSTCGYETLSSSQRRIAATLTLSSTLPCSMSLSRNSPPRWPRAAPVRSAISVQWLATQGYRRARKKALSLWRAAKPKPAALHAAVAAAAEQQSAWRRMTSVTNGRTCLRPSRRPRARSGSSVPRCSRWRSGPVRTKHGRVVDAELQARLQALLADAQTLYKLPELARLRTRSA